MACCTWMVPGAIAALVAASACGDDIELSELARRAAEVRELDFSDEVDVLVMTREEFADQAAANADAIDDAQLVEIAETWGRLGYFPMDLDLRPILAGSSSDWVGATYSPNRKRITLVGEVEESVEVHEYVHALQDQNFSLAAYDGTTSDSFLARRAVVEGDAVLAEARFMMEEMYEAGLDEANWGEQLVGRRRWADEFLAEAAYPVFFLDYPSFVYTYGLEYTADNLLGINVDDLEAEPAPHDWGREDELFVLRPPASTQQVLLRDIDVDAVEEVGLDAVPAGQASRLQLIDWDTLGEWYIHLLLYSVADPSQSRALAAAWDGDRVLFVRDMDTSEVATVWASAWDDEATAAMVRSVLVTLYGHEAVADAPAELGLARDGEPVWLEQRGNLVVVAKNLDPELAPAIADAALDPPARIRTARRRPPLAARLGRDLSHDRVD